MLTAVRAADYGAWAPHGNRRVLHITVMDLIIVVFKYYNR